MKYYIQFDENGDLITRFDDHKAYLPHPAGTVEVDETLWWQTINETDGIWKRDIVTGEITKHPRPLPPLIDIQKSAKAKIDSAAEASRLQFITSGSGQAIVYELKRNELLNYDKAISDGLSPVPDDYPLMNERANRKFITLDDVATEWRMKVLEWTGIAAQIEGLREGAKEAIDAVADTLSAQPDIEVIVNGIIWPVPA